MKVSKAQDRCCARSAFKKGFHIGLTFLLPCIG
jgi:hypothetical protein